MIHACELCKYKDKCVDRPTSNVKDCNVFVMQEPQTNADRIRNMTDEELAEFFDRHIDCDIIFGRCIHLNVDDIAITCKQCMLQWLKSEVKE